MHEPIVGETFDVYCQRTDPEARKRLLSLLPSLVWASTGGGRGRWVPPESTHVSPAEPRRAKIVTLIGSSKFRDLHRGHEQRLTLAGCMVLGRGFFHHVDMRPITDEEHEMLDALQLLKVAMADEVFVVSRDGYIGESTKRAIAHAKGLGKTVTYSGDESRGH